VNYKTGNILDNVKKGVIVHQVNCQGKMNSGIAKEIRERWPEVFLQYRAKWQKDTWGDMSGECLLGHVQWVEVEIGLWIVNLFGQQYYGSYPGSRYTSYDALDDGFKTIAWTLPGKGLQPEDVNLPLIGCGLGGGKWPVVEGIISANLGDKPTVWSLS